MAIQRKPRLNQPSAADAFIQGAPDAQAQPEAPAGQTYQKGVRKGNKRQISLTITPALLEKVDAMAAHCWKRWTLWPQKWGNPGRRLSTWQSINWSKAKRSMFNFACLISAGALL